MGTGTQRCNISFRYFACSVGTEWIGQLRPSQHQQLSRRRDNILLIRIRRFACCSMCTFRAEAKLPMQSSLMNARTLIAMLIIWVRPPTNGRLILTNIFCFPDMSVGLFSYFAPLDLGDIAITWN